MSTLKPHAEEAEQLLAEFSVASEPGNEREAMRLVAETVERLSLTAARLDRLKTAVAEATMNAIEHGNKNRPEIPVEIKVARRHDRLIVRITDTGVGPSSQAATPDLEAKLAGEQTPRGWGLFLIQNMVDEMSTSGDEHHHTVELVLNMNGAQDASDAL
jgi:serine/threonine-protein kinase RsbW